MALAFAASGGALFVSTVAVEQGCEKEAPKPAAGEPIVIGVSLGLTRDLSSFAAPLRDAVRAAEGEINAGGGVLGRPLRFDVADDRSDEGDFVTSVARGFASKRVVANIGPIGSQQVVLTHQIFADSQIIQISPSATSTELSTIQSPEDRWFFRTTPADDFQGAAVILFAARTPRGLGDGGVPLNDAGAPVTCSRLAVVHIDNSYGNSMTDVIVKNFSKGGPGRSVVVDKKVPIDQKPSYQADVAEIFAQNPECIAVIAYEKVAAQFIRDCKADPSYPAREANGLFFIGTDGVFTPGFLELSLKDQADETSASTAEGVYGVNPDTQPGTPEYNAFKTIYSSYFPLKNAPDAPAFTANAFDAAVLIALAIQRAGTVDDRVRLRDALREVATPPGVPVTPAEIGAGLLDLRDGRDIDYKGASGDVDFGPNGNVTSGFIVWQAFRNPETKKVEYRTVARFKTEELLDQIK